jgi:hypothetical protein
MRCVRSLFILAAALGLAAPVARAQSAAPAEYPGLENGKMWTFDVPPTEYWATRYNFRPSVAWLDHARMSALRQPGCTASFVSPDGLVMTNHHCARQCIVTATRPGEDLLTNGFYAARREDERSCGANFYVESLLSITDVTDSVTAAVGTATGTPAAELRAAVQQRLETACRGGEAGIVCQLVPMYRGGQYKLYRFRRYTDIRLVFAPEDSIAFFGGDPDNFVFPRHDLDMSFYRAYVNNQPARIEHYFRWSRGAQEGDLVFVISNPGTTNRLNPISYLEFLRDVQLPASLADYRRRLSVYHEYGRVAPARAAAFRNDAFSIENDQKRSIVYLESLRDPEMMARKQAQEQELRNRVQADPALRRQYGTAWTDIAAVRRQMAPLDVRRRYYGFGAYGTRLLNYASMIVRSAVEGAKPDSARLPVYRQSNRANFERILFDTTTAVDTDFETRMLTAYLTAMQAELPANDPVLRAALMGMSPEDAARQMVQGSVVVTGIQRRVLTLAGAPVIDASTDPFIRLAKIIDPLQRDIDRQWTELLNREVPANERIARAMLAVYGTSVAPDANFTLRISDGVVATYPYNGTLAQPFTTFYGLYDRSYGFGGRVPFNLPMRWQMRRDSLNLSTPFNAISTNDLIGGSSGSPVINRDGEIVGLIFDGNMESLPWRFLFSEASGRAVWLDSRGIIEALRRVYGAGAMADELTGGR